MTVHDIIMGISQKLDRLYPDCHIYTDKRIEQGLETPAFFIEPLRGSAGPGYMKGRLVHRLFSISYFPQEDGSREECAGVGDVLELDLALIGLPGGDLLRGTDISYTIQAGVLHLSVSIDFAVSDASRVDAMQTVTDIIRVKE
jgi:hypothetical protein